MAVASDSFSDVLRIWKWHLEVVKLIHSVYYMMGDRSSCSERLLLSIDFYTEAQLQSYTACNFIKPLDVCELFSPSVYSMDHYKHFGVLFVKIGPL